MPLGISAGTGAVIAGGLTAAGGVASSLIQSGTAGKAGAQAQRNLQLILPQMQQSYVNTLAQYQPYTETGQKGLTATTDLLGLNGPDAAKTAMDRFQTSPGYQFQMEQGLRAIDAGAAAGRTLPGVDSGATRKAEMTFGQNLANLDFGNYYNRLSALSGQGLTAAQGVANANQNLISQEEGNAQSQNAAITNTANAQNSATGNLFSGLGNTLNSLMVNPAVQQTLGIGQGSTPGNLSSYGATPSSYQTAPGFQIGDATQNPNSYWV
jgi:hypothetical protein